MNMKIIFKGQSKAMMNDLITPTPFEPRFTKVKTAMKKYIIKPIIDKKFIIQTPYILESSIFFSSCIYFALYQIIYLVNYIPRPNK